MSRIDELVERLCPDGVAYRPLGEVGTFLRGSGLQKKDLIAEGLPAIHYGQIHTLYGVWTEVSVSRVEPEHATRLKKAQPGDLLIATTSEDDEAVAKAVAWLGSSPVAISGDSFAFHHELDPKYVSYYFQSRGFQDQKRNRITGTKVRRISASALSGILIPVPSLEVQAEIVRVLDCFTSLEAELEAELEARRRQFDHYRRQRMTFSDSVSRVRIGDIAEVRSGWGFPLAYQGVKEGELPFYKVGDMNLSGNGTHLSVANNYISSNVAKKLGARPSPAGTVVFPKIGAALVTNKKRILSQSSVYDNNVMGLIPGESVLSSFLYHWLQTIDLVDLANDSGAIPSIRKSTVENQLMPLPNVDSQKEVSTSLDLFDALSHSLTEGLPAEIAARRQQYEYYRDRLLTFKEKAS